MSPLLLVVLLAVCATAGLYALLSASGSERNAPRQGLEGLASRSSAPPSRTMAPQPTRRETLNQASREFRRFDLYRNTELALERAGLRLLPFEWAIAVVGAGLLVGVILWAVYRSVLLGAAMPILFALLSPVVLKFLQAQRMAKFERNLPDALELMAASLRSGQGFQRALQVTAEDMPSPVSDEFSLAVQDISLGRSVEEALAGIWHRVPSYEMELITTAVGIQLQVGGNLSEILGKIAETLRERARIRGEISTLTAEGKMSAYIVFAMPILLFFYLNNTNPGYMKPLTTEDTGRLILLVAIIAEIIGIGIIWKMVNMEV